MDFLVLIRVRSDQGAGVKDDREIAADEVEVAGKVDGAADVRDVANYLGFGSFAIDLSCTDSKRLSFQDCELSVRSCKRSPGALFILLAGRSFPQCLKGTWRK